MKVVMNFLKKIKWSVLKSIKEMEYIEDDFVYCTEVPNWDHLTDYDELSEEGEDVLRFENESANHAPAGKKGIIYDIPTDGLFQVKWPNGKLKYEWEYKDGKRADGISKGWWSNGKLKQTQTWKNNTRNGLWTMWYPSGQKKEEEPNRSGLRHGLSISWYDNGQKMYERTFKNDTKDGLWIEWYENGQ